MSKIYNIRNELMFEEFFNNNKNLNKNLSLREFDKFYAITSKKPILNSADLNFAEYSLETVLPSGKTMGKLVKKEAGNVF